MIWHPLNEISEGWPLWTAFITLLILTGTIARNTQWDLKTEASPWAVISYELAGTEEKARKIIKAWDDKGVREQVFHHFRWDNIWIFLYSTLLALGCVMTVRVLQTPGSFWYSFFLGLAWAAWLAGLLDLIENYTLERMLGGFSGETLPRLAWACASVKFIICALAAVYLLIGLIARLCGYKAS